MLSAIKSEKMIKKIPNNTHNICLNVILSSKNLNRMSSIKNITPNNIYSLIEFDLSSSVVANPENEVPSMTNINLFFTLKDFAKKQFKTKSSKKFIKNFAKFMKNVATRSLNLT